jgi:X-linked retinitis pigmentosa GTPase regulator
MKYLDVLKDYNKAIVSESKKLDEIYKKLLGESCEDTDANKDDDTKKEVTTEGEEKTCDCGKDDCPICGKKKVDEGCDKDKQMSEFDEGEKADGKSAKKMLDKSEFFGNDGDKGKDDSASDDTKTDDEKNDGDEKKDDSAADDTKKVDEGSDDNTKMSAADLFGEDEDKGEETKTDDTATTDDTAKTDDADKGEETKTDDGETKDDVTSEDALDKEIKEFFGMEESEDAAKTDDDTQTTDDDSQVSEDDILKGKQHNGHVEESEKKDDASSEETKTDDTATDDTAKTDDAAKGEETKTDDDTKKVDEGEKLTMKQIMAKESKAEETKTDDAEKSDEEREQEQLNESIQAITKFVKANKYFKTVC